MYRVPQAGLTKPAVAGQLERGVRPHRAAPLDVFGFLHLLCCEGSDHVRETFFEMAELTRWQSGKDGLP